MFFFVSMLSVWTLNCSAIMPVATQASTSALVIVDMQDYYFERNGMYIKNSNQRKFDEAIAVQIKLIKQAIKLNQPIVLVEYPCDECGQTNKQLRDATANYANVKTIKKTSDGMFDNVTKNNNEIGKYLTTKNVKTLVVAGANGGSCIRASIEGALKNNYNVIAVSDAIADFNYPAFIYPYTDLKQIIRCKSCPLKEVNSADLARVLGEPPISGYQKVKTEEIKTAK